MQCPCPKTLTDFIFGSPHDLAGIEAHVAGCAACTRFLDGIYEEADAAWQEYLEAEARRGGDGTGGKAMLSIRSFGITDTGLHRTVNEDCFDTNDGAQFYIVADGMGGHDHGEVASRLAVRSVRESLTTGHPPPASGDGHASRLRRAIGVAHRQIRDAMRNNASLLGMGTTIVCAMLGGQTMIIGHVGDSRAYRHRSGVLDLLTNDHTWVFDQMLAGRLSEAEAQKHPLRNVVTRAVGGEVLAVDITEVGARESDLFLLCSDGLNTMLTDAEIGAWLSSGASLREIGHGLVNAANGKGGADNVTVVLLRVTGSEPVDPLQPSTEAGAAAT